MILTLNGENTVVTTGIIIYDQERHLFLYNSRFYNLLIINCNIYLVKVESVEYKPFD